MQSRYDYRTKTVNELVLLRKHGQLNLEPAFQRQSVWTIPDRRKLVESLLDRKPIPSIFLYRREGWGGKLVYDVIDGKQRIETILMFMGTGGFGPDDRFDVKPMMEDASSAWTSWGYLSNADKNLIRSTELQVVEVDWELSEVIDLFVSINSTGKRLTGAEKLNAKWVNSPFLVTAKKLADSNKPWFSKNRVFSTAQMTRMKHVELVAELLASLHAGGPINKKKELDRLIAGGTIAAPDLAWARTELQHSFKRVETLFPTLGQTRFKTGSELYTLTLLVHEMAEDGYILTNSQRNALAQQMLINFGVGVDTVSDKIKAGKGATADQALYLEYLNTVRSDTDSQKSRKKRAQILTAVLAGIFEPKDIARGFSPAQRRILWHSSTDKRCAARGCRAKLTWTDFTIDHIRPHSKGGLTDLSNAQLMCKSHNSAKGAR